jgi:hypothetical protein
MKRHPGKAFAQLDDLSLKAGENATSLRLVRPRFAIRELPNKLTEIRFSEFGRVIFCARRMSKVKMPKIKKSFARQPFDLRLIPGPPGIKLASRPGIWDKSPTAAGRHAASASLVHRYAPSPRPKWRQRSRPGLSRQSRAVSLQKGCVSEIMRGRKNRLLRRRNAQRGAPRAQFAASLAG